MSEKSDPFHQVIVVFLCISTSIKFRWLYWQGITTDAMWKENGFLEPGADITGKSGFLQ